jgi:hypothetical protein
MGGAGGHALTLRPRHRRPVRCVSLVVKKVMGVHQRTAV